jgi:hypothetical protein
MRHQTSRGQRDVVRQTQIENGGARGTPTREVAGGGPRPGGRSIARAQRTAAGGNGNAGAGVRTTLGNANATKSGQIAGGAGR